MLSRTFEHTLHSMLSLTREMFLILAIGVLGSQILITLNGGAPIGTEAQTSNYSTWRLPISSFEIYLDPLNPTAVRSVYVQLSSAVGGTTEQLRLSTTQETPENYPCHIELPAVWHCLTPGLTTVELKDIFVSDLKL
jgi:hypothetical protein